MRAKPVGDWTIILAPTGAYALCMGQTDNLLTLPAGAPKGGGTVMLYEYRTRQARPLASFPGQVDVRSISPDGEWIALGITDVNTNGAPAGDTRLWLARASGGPVREVTGRPYVLVQGGNLVWSDAGRAYFTALPVPRDNADTGFLYELNVVQADARIVNAERQLQFVASVSSDGRRLVVVRGGGDPHKTDLNLLELGASATPALPTPTVEPAG